MTKPLAELAALIAGGYPNHWPIHGWSPGGHIQRRRVESPITGQIALPVSFFPPLIE